MSRRPLLAALLVLTGACRSTTAPAPSEHIDPSAVLPAGAPYISGTVVERGDRLGQGGGSVLVATDPRDPVADPTDRDGNRSAHVVLGEGVLVVHRDGRRGRTDELRPGHVVSAWVGPTELRSLPPVVFGRVLVIERE